MSTVSRRDFLRLAGTMAGAVAGAGALGACATGSTSSGGSSSGASTAKSVLQSSLSDPDPKKALQTLVADYPQRGDPEHGRHRAVPRTAADLPQLLATRPTS